MTDVAPLLDEFADVDVKWAMIPLPYSPALRRGFAERAGEIAQNLTRPVRAPWRGRQFVLRNPHPDAILGRFTDNRPFSFMRLPHGFWDCWLRHREVAARLTADSRCRQMSQRQVAALADALLIRAYPHLGCFTEGFFADLEADIRARPRDRNVLMALAFKGLPTFDDTPLGYDHPELVLRLDMVGEFFDPDETLYDAMLWKRWTLTGHISRLPAAVRDHPVIMIGPPKFASLGELWGLSDYTHVEIPPADSESLRVALLPKVRAALESRPPTPGRPSPVLFSQCGGELAYHFALRLRPERPDVFYVDMGQAMDIWYWTDAPWLKIYGDAIRASNPGLPAAAWTHSGVG